MPQVPLTKAITLSTYRELISDISEIYEKAQKHFVRSYWEIGKRIIEVEQDQQIKAKYGAYLIERLSEDLTAKYGNGFSVRNIQYMRRFYLTYRIAQAPAQLDWTHYQLLSGIKEKGKREELERQVIRGGLGSRQLKDLIKRSRLQTKAQQLFRETTLRVSRGQLYTYRIKTIADVSPLEKKTLVDSGFSVLRDVPLAASENFRDGDCVHSIKTGDGYRLEKVAAEKKDLYTYVAFLDRVIDGDTMWLYIDCGFGTWIREKIRLKAIDTPELASQKGQEARTFVERCLKPCPFVIIKTYGSDKYDRYVADLFYAAGEKEPAIVAREGVFLNQQLLDAHRARPFA
ncbi:MAG: thermonuclease family protein [Candidatus Omnitrophica bacterium]|nr:thermonuclease family protein [Candidatus Omnitrophota bacterium]